jgi:hypothetical protein
LEFVSGCFNVWEVFRPGCLRLHVLTSVARPCFLRHPHPPVERQLHSLQFQVWWPALNQTASICCRRSCTFPRQQTVHRLSRPSFHLRHAANTSPTSDTKLSRTGA